VERLFKRNKRSKLIRHKCLLAIDFENNPETGEFICAGIFGKVRKRLHRGGKYSDGLPFGRYFTSLTELEAYLISLKKNSCVLTFFNAGYDKAFISNIVDASSVLENRGRLITMRLKSGLKCIDLCNHVSEGSLADWIGYLDMEQRFGIKKVGLEDLEQRVMSDAEATFRLGEFIEDFYTKECNIPMQLTVASSALRLFAQTYFRDYWKRTEAQSFVNKLERNAYYGGRVEMFKRGKQLCKSYDVNSMYLSIMREALIPDMSTFCYIENGRRWQYYFERYLGIYHCRVLAPRSKVMVLPYRTDKGKLIFPCGEFSGWWTSVELKAALEYGYQILEVYEFIYYRRAKPYFSGFAEFVWEKRQAYKLANNLGMQLMIKKIGNSLYGKFGQQNQEPSYLGAASEAPVIPKEAKRFYFKHPVTGEIWLWVGVVGEAIPAKFEFPAVCAFITSYARVKLLRALKANEEAVIYCDTDSIKLKGDIEGVTVGEGLGEWAFLGEMEYSFYKPKWYGDKCKGVPKRAKLIYMTDSEARFDFEKPLREREALKRCLVPNKWITVTKYLSLLDDKRSWVGKNSFPIILGMFNNLVITEWAAMEKEYGTASKHQDKLVYGEGKKSRYADMGVEDRRQAELEKLDKRRSGNMIYQRGVT
jgi:hypothetical protein